jgi:cell division protein FtsI (penicillin-binding protein 3)
VRTSSRLRWGPFGVVAIFALALLSQLRVQAVGREAILEKGLQSNRFVVERVQKARRGTILTADGKQLAAAEERSELGILFDKVPNSPAFFMALGRASGIPAAEFQQLKASGSEKAFWQERLSPAKTRAVRAVRSEWRADGVSLARAGARVYPFGSASACVVGYLRDGEALTGIEKAFDKELRGRDGKTIGMVDRGGDFLPLRLDPESVERRDGKDVTLTIDSELQVVAASAVKQAVEANQADQGCAIVIEPATGNILAMANWPSFDPERIGEPGVRFSDFNPNYMAQLEPGSTFKILTLAEALERGKIEKDESYACTGSLAVWANRSIRCDAHGGSRAHGTVDPVAAIAKSCNCWAATLALRIGHEPFTEFLEKSGLVAKPGIGLPGEVGGAYNRNEFAKRLQLATFGFGQSLTVTPLALCSAFATLGNGGVRMHPKLISAVGETPTPIRPAGRLYSEATAAEVMRAMEAVFSSSGGTGKSLRIPGYRLAGKTGTAQKINPQTGTVEGGGYVSNFIGFVPAEKPKAAILVMVDNPKSGRYYGATVAGPVFQELARAVIRRFDVPKSEERPEGSKEQKAPPARLGSIGPLGQSAPKAQSGPAVTVSSRPVPARAQGSRRG